MEFTRPVASLLIMDGRFPHIITFFSVLKIGVPMWLSGENRDFKKTVIDDVTL